MPQDTPPHVPVNVAPNVLKDMPQQMNQGSDQSTEQISDRGTNTPAQPSAEPSREITTQIALLFPGQGSQSIGMGRALFDAHAEARAVFEEADDILGFSLSKLIFEGPEGDLALTENTQPAILTTSIAIWRVLEPQLKSRNLPVCLAAGHSLGEYSAHVAAQTFSFADAVRTVRARGQFMQSAVPVGQGAMAAVIGLSYEKVNDLCARASDELTAPPPDDPADPGEQSAAARDALANPFNPATTPAEAASRVSAVVSPANINSPLQIVIAGGAKAVARASELCREAGAKRILPLAVSAPFHCALMQPAQESLATQLESVAFHDPCFPVICNADARAIKRGEDARDTLIRQVTGAVRWSECIEQLKVCGATHFLEVGPGRVLTGLNRQIDRALQTAQIEDPATLDAALGLFA